MKTTVENSAAEKIVKKSTSKKSEVPMLTITLVKSFYGRLPKHRETVRGLGLRKIRQSVRLEGTPAVRGMVRKISYLLHVEER